MMLKLAAIAAVAMLLSACDERPATDKLLAQGRNITEKLAGIRSQLIDRPSHRIDEIFEADTIGSALSFIENKIGPSKYIRGDVRTYIVDGCTVIIGYGHDTVRNIGINGLSRRCQFPLKRFQQAAPEIDLVDMTFGDLTTPGRASFQISWSCVSGCGNAVDPSMSLHVDGPHSDDFIDILVTEEYPYANEREYSKSTFALERLLKSRGAYSTGELCIKSLSAAFLTRNVSIKSIRVGRDLDKEKHECEMNL